MRDIGKNIKQLRTERGMTQETLAERLFVTRQTVSNYETGKSRPDIDMLEKISQVLGTDIQTVIYGPQPKEQKPEVRRLIIGCIVTGIFGILWVVLTPIAEAYQKKVYSPGLVGYSLYYVIKPLCCLLGGWTLMYLLGMALKKKPLSGKWVRRTGIVVLVVLLIWLALTFLFAGLASADNWLYINHIRGEWEETVMETEEGPYVSRGWSRVSLPMVEELGRVISHITILIYKMHIPYYVIFLPWGAALWLLGFPGKWKKE